MVIMYRKLSGLFLLAGKLDAKFNCYSIWRDIREADVLLFSLARVKPYQSYSSYSDWLELSRGVNKKRKVQGKRERNLEKNSLKTV